LLLEDPRDRVFAALVSPDGRVAEGSPLEASGKPVRAANGEPKVYDGRVDDEPVRIAELAVRDRGAPGWRVRVAETLVKREELAREIALSALLPQALTIVLMIVLVWLGVDRGLLPVEGLQRSLALRSHLDRSPVREEGLPAELRPLVHSINGVLER